MMKYAGYVIVTEPDYKTALEQQEPPEDLYCMVYDEADTSQSCCLMDFPMTQAIEYEESTVDSIEEGIKMLLTITCLFWNSEKRNGFSSGSLPSSIGQLIC